MVGSQDEDRISREPSFLQRSEEFPELIINVSDLLIVEHGPVALSQPRVRLVALGWYREEMLVGLRWRVRVVHLIGMQEQKEALVPVPLEPFSGSGEGNVDLTGGTHEVGALVLGIGVEPTLETYAEEQSTVLGKSSRFELVITQTLGERNQAEVRRELLQATRDAMN